MFSSFQPDTDDEFDVPYFDDVTSSNGWEGQATSKTIQTLMSEISTNMTRLGCLVTGIVPGKFGDRYGFQIQFAIKGEGGAMIPSRMDIACLPLNPKKRKRSSQDKRIEATKKMGLYMANKAFKGMYFLTALAPGFMPFLSLMLVNAKGQTLGELWVAKGNLKALGPGKGTKFNDAEIIDGEVDE